MDAEWISAAKAAKLAEIPRKTLMVWIELGLVSSQKRTLLLQPTYRVKLAEVIALRDARTECTECPK